MTTSPAIRCGHALVVFEGSSRVHWRRDGRAEWTPLGVWPDERETALVRQQLEQRQPLLVILSGIEASVALLDDQYERAPRALAAISAEVAGGLVELRIPALDWLPADLRRRGFRFLRESVQRAAATPGPLRAPLALEPRDLVTPHVRFAHRVSSCPYLERDLDAVVDYAFGDLPLELAA